MDRLDRVQRMAAKMIRGQKSLPCEEGVMGALITMLQYLRGGYKENEDLLFTRSCIEKIWGNGFKFLLEISHLNTRGKVFLMGTISHWPNLPSPTFRNFQGLAGESAGPSCLNCAFAKKEWTR